MPFDGARTLDIGCGTGELLGCLKSRSDDLWGVDPDPTALVSAADHGTTVQGDFLTTQLPAFNYIVSVASLHHMPLMPALKKMRTQLKDGGKLYILGLHRLSTPLDYLVAGLSWLPETAESIIRGKTDPEVAMKDPAEDYAEIKSQAEKILPGARIRRRRHYRFSIEWSRT
ncbi:Methyltransferase domain protein [Corynebacterium kalinowskii]|uniref:Methyltransferase domain protein n=2 Tax=Corynebacterium kalinowskii TaxID=2675216 RepID=A0A6B8W4I2_9CORY|nr:class I SAM-dependent methyltransferase [Corynebacterium kalinowskii]QGU02308.1 Methyltransferase domain protein [Corynebacterium kalinowskii]